MCRLVRILVSSHTWEYSQHNKLLLKSDQSDVPKVAAVVPSHPAPGWWTFFPQLLKFKLNGKFVQADLKVWVYARNESLCKYALKFFLFNDVVFWILSSPPVKLVMVKMKGPLGRAGRWYFRLLENRRCTSSTCEPAVSIADPVQDHVE